MTLKTNQVAWDAPAGAIHNLAHIQGLSAERTALLCVSERVYYVLLNLVAEEVGYRARYARETSNFGFVPVKEADAEWTLYQEVVEAAQTEVIDMSCDVVEVLENILAELESCCSTQSDLLAALASANNNQAMADYGESHPYYDPPSQNLAPPIDTTAFCKRCWSFGLDFVEANIEAHKQAGIIGTGGIGILMIIFGIIDLPLGILVGIAAVIVAVALELDEATYESILNDSIPDLVCAIYTADTSAEAVGQLKTVIQSLPTLNARTKNMLASQMCNDVVDRIFDETYPTDPAAPSDCSSCEEPPSGLVLTALTTPYNVIEKGWLIDYNAESEAYGWSSTAGGRRLEIAFSPGSNVTDVSIELYIGAIPVDRGIGVAIFHYPDWQLMWTSEFFYVEEAPPGTDKFAWVAEDINLVGGEEYRFHVAKPTSGEVWSNRIVIDEYTP
jgi:hypothetical protein